MAKSTLIAHKKFLMLVRTLGIPVPHAIGHLECLWQSSYVTGPAFRSKEEIEVCAQWAGEPDQFADALCDPRHTFIDTCADGTFLIHNFVKHAPEYATKRLKREQERSTTVVKRRSKRTYSGEICLGLSENVGKRRKSAARITEPNRTQPNLTQPNQAEIDPPDPPLPTPMPESSAIDAPARPSAPVSASAFPRRTAAEKSTQREREVEIRVERLMQFESDRNRGVATAIMWRTRVRAMARLPGGLIRCDEIADEIESRRNRRVAETKGFSTDRIENEAAWANQQTESWLKKHEPKSKAQ